MGDPARHEVLQPQGAQAPPVETQPRAAGMGSQDESFFAGKPRSDSPAAARRAHGKKASRRPIVLVLVLVLVLAGGAAYYLIRKHNTSSATTTSSTSASPATVRPARNPLVGQSITVPVNGTTLEMVITRVLDPAPDRRAAGARNVTVAAYATVTNGGSKAYALNNLGVRMLQSHTAAGNKGVSPTSAGVALRQTGSLAPGATDSGWLTVLATKSAGRVTSWDVVFNARAATGVFSISKDWTLK